MSMDETSQTPDPEERPELVEPEPEDDESEEDKQAAELLLKLLDTAAAQRVLGTLDTLAHEIMEERQRTQEAEAQLAVERQRHEANLEKLKQEHAREAQTQKAELETLKEQHRQAFHVRSLHWTSGMKIIGLAVLLGGAIALSLCDAYKAEIATLFGAVAGYLLSKQTEGG